MIGSRSAGSGREAGARLGQSAAQIVCGIVGLGHGRAEGRIHQGRAEEDIVQLAAGDDAGDGRRGILPIGGHPHQAESGVGVPVGRKLGIEHRKRDVGAEDIVVGGAGGLAGVLGRLAVAYVLVHVADEQVLVVVGVGGEIAIDVLDGAVGFDGSAELVDVGVAGLVVHGPEHEGPLGVWNGDDGPERIAGELDGARGRHGAGRAQDREAAGKAEVHAARERSVCADGCVGIAQAGGHVRPGGECVRPQLLEADDISVHAGEGRPDGVVLVAPDRSGAEFDVVGGHADRAGNCRNRKYWQAEDDPEGQAAVNAGETLSEVTYEAVGFRLHEPIAFIR